MLFTGFLAVGACARSEPEAAPAPLPSDAPPHGEYRLDPSHASLLFKVDHIGFSNYVGQFKKFDATLHFDPDAPEKMQIHASIDVRSLDVPAPPQGFLETLTGPDWLNAVEFPTMEFRSQRVKPTGDDAAQVEGVLSFRGRSSTIILNVRYNGGYAGYPPYENQARIGFSAAGALKRSDFGVDLAIPSQEAPIGVSDVVSFEVEAEFLGPPSAPD
jgi:polyisoprenoid-binding protein YceI